MRELTSTALAWIVCLYVFIGCLYVCNKDYTGERAEVSTAITYNRSDIVHIYVPEYKIHLEMPKEEWLGQDDFILQKDYKCCCMVYCYLGLPILASFIGFIILTGELFK